MIYNLCSLPTCWNHSSLITVSPLWASFETGLKNNGFVKHRCRSRYQGAQAEPRRLSENSTPTLLRSSAQPLSAQLSLRVTLGHPGLPLLFTAWHSAVLTPVLHPGHTSCQQPLSLARFPAKVAAVGGPKVSHPWTAPSCLLRRTECDNSQFSARSGVCFLSHRETLPRPGLELHNPL